MRSEVHGDESFGGRDKGSWRPVEWWLQEASEGCLPINLQAPVRYEGQREGGH